MSAKAIALVAYLTSLVGLMILLDMRRKALNSLLCKSGLQDQPMSHRLPTIDHVKLVAMMDSDAWNPAPSEMEEVKRYRRTTQACLVLAVVVFGFPFVAYRMFPS